MKEEFYLPEPGDIQRQSERNKQGRSEQELPPEIQRKFIEYLNEAQKDSYDRYLGFVEQGIARELSRINLPLSLYTEWYWKIDLHNLFHFLKLRLDEHAQMEIREYAKVMSELVRGVCPMAWEAFRDYSLTGETFSGPELAILNRPFEAVTQDIAQLVAAGLSKGEAREFLEKLERIRGRQQERG